MRALFAQYERHAAEHPERAASFARLAAQDRQGYWTLEDGTVSLTVTERADGRVSCGAAAREPPAR